MFLRVVDFIAEWLGPVLILAGVAAWFAGRVDHAFPAGALLPLGGAVFSVLALLAAIEEKKEVNIVVCAVAIAAGAAWAAWTYFAA